MSSNKRSRPIRSSSSAGQNPTTGPQRRIVDAHEDEARARRTTPLLPSDPSSLQSAGEWLRGKGELVWESAFVPVLGWLAHLLDRVGLGGRMRHINQRTVRNTGELRTWNDAGAGMLKRVTRILMVAAISAAVLVVVSALAVRAIGALSKFQPNISLGSGASSTATPPGAITIHTSNGGTPVGIPQYTFGMWMSNNSPAPGEETTVYGKVMHLNAPAPNIKVTFNIGGSTTTVTTDQDGIAAWKIGAGGGGDTVQVNGAVTVGGQNLTASTFYTSI